MELVRKANNFPELSDTDWLWDFCFCWGHRCMWTSIKWSYKGNISLCTKCTQTWEPYGPNLLYSWDKFQQMICSFPHTSYAERGSSTCEDKQQITRRLALRILPSVLTSHFSRCHVPFHNTLKQHRKIFNRNSSMFKVTPSEWSSSTPLNWMSVMLH